MSQEIVRPRIAWANGQDIFGYGVHQRFLQEKGIEVVRYRHALKLLDACKEQKYPLIVTDIELAPGEGYREDSAFAKIMGRAHHRCNPDYSEIALQMIREIRAIDTHYAQIPILIATITSPETDGLYPLAEKHALEAGATEYYCTFTEKVSVHDLTDKIARYVRNPSSFCKTHPQK